MGDSDFGEMARQARIKARMTLRQVAAQLGFSTVYISDMERGARKPPVVEKAREWADLLGADADEFVALADAARDRVDVPRSDVALELARMRGVPSREHQDLIVSILRRDQRKDES